MTHGNILICDDSEDAGKAYKKGLDRIDTVEENFGESILVGKTELEQAIEALERRLRQVSREEIGDYPLDDAANIIDNAAVLVIDYALFDLDKNELFYKRVPYDVESAAQKIRDADLSDVLADRLLFGR